MAVEYDISSDVAVIKETGSVSQCARVTQMYSGQITYDDEAGSKFATATINGKSQRVMLCIAVSGTVTYDDVPSLYSTVDGHRCLNIVTPTETGTPDDVPSLYETVVIDGQNVRAVRCIMINKTPVYDGVSSVCTFTGDDGKTHTAQLVNKVTGGSVEVIIKGTSPLNLPDAIANSLSYVKAFGGTEQGIPDGYTLVDFIMSDNNSYIETDISVDDSDEVDFYWHTDRTGSIFAFSQGASADNAAFQLANATSATPPGVVFDIGNYTPYRVLTGVNANTNTMLHIQIINKEIFIDGVSYGTSSGTLAAPTDKLRLFCTSAGVSSVSYMGRFTVKGKIDLFPCTRDSDGVVGFYDAISGTFLTNAGTGTLTAGLPAAAIKATPDNPVQIISNNGVLKFSLNEFDPNAVELGYYRNANTGARTESPYNFLTAMMPVKPSTSYVLFGRRKLDNRLSAYNRIYWFDSNQNFISTSSYSVNTVTVATSPANAAYAQGGINESGGTSIPTTQEIIDDYNWFFQQGTAEMSYTPYSPTGIYTDGTVETINVHGGKNLFNKATISKYTLLSTTTGETIPQQNEWSWCSDFIPVTPDTAYYFKSGANWNVRIFEYASDQSYTSRKYTALNTSFTTGSTTAYIRFHIGAGTGGQAMYDGETMVSLGSTATDYTPYYNSDPATAEMLLKVGDYQDVQEILSGAVTRNVGIMVLDGTEGWQLATATNLVQFYTSSTQGVIANSVSIVSTIAPYGCTVANRTQYDFGCYSGGTGNLCFQMKGSATLTTATAWAQWLAAQYAAGTPVIVIYPLATPTTESVAGQTLQVTDGDNILEITQASLNGLELEAQYNAAVSLTIQEVEDANLDNNVTVTIQ